MIYVLCSTKVLTDHLNHRYLATKAKLNGKEAKWIEELAAFDFTIIYHERVKNPIDGLSRRSNFKDDSELFATRRQLLPNFLSKFQEHLGGTKNDPAEEQSIDFDETFLPRNVLSLIGVPQGTNSARMLPARSESKSDPAEE